jgi:hypothetical protein
MLRRLLPWLLCLLLAALAVFQLRETRRLAEALGGQEVHARELQERVDDDQRALADRQRETERLTGQLASAHNEVTAAQQRGETLQKDVDRLGVELQRALAERRGINEILAKKAQEEASAREAKATAQRQANAPMPEGVRLALMALHECLRADGFYGLRFLDARGLEDHELKNVELHDWDPQRLIGASYFAARMSVHLDRAKGEITFRFFEGWRRADGKRIDFPPEGFALQFAPVDGKLWETRLPYLVVGEGDYPEDLDAARKRQDPDTTDPDTRRHWLERLNALLAKARTDDHLNVSYFRGMKDDRFRNVAVQGYDDKSRLTSLASAKTMAIEIDKKTDLVSLWLSDGNLLGRGGESTITSEGYRILLLGVTPAQADAAMLGMVVRK